MNIDRMLFFDNIREDETINKAVRIFSALDRNKTSGQFLDPSLISAYYDIQRTLLRSVTSGDPELTCWQNYVLHLVDASENPFSLRAEKETPDEMTMALAAGDMEEIRELLDAEWQEVADKIWDDRPCVCSAKASAVTENPRIRELNRVFAGSPEKAVRDLADYYRHHMCGLIGMYRVFIWDGGLRGVPSPDPITFDELVGYEVQQKQLIDNTEKFIEGHRANNVLLYGDKGTGKSSSVKALVNKFADRGLRMISLPKDHIFDIVKIMESVSGRGCRFIIFIDDLSFEETETEYKKFKSVLDGGVEVQPENVLVYVTSNRRNLVKEMWSDRGESGEVHAADGIQERQSLADRFGLTITFLAPGKSLYNDIVRSIAKREGVDIDDETLMKEADRWDMRQTSRSGRSARQFITHISGK